MISAYLHFSYLTGHQQLPLIILYNVHLTAQACLKFCWYALSLWHVFLLFQHSTKTCPLNELDGILPLFWRIWGSLDHFCSIFVSHEGYTTSTILTIFNSRCTFRAKLFWRPFCSTSFTDWRVEPHKIRLGFALRSLTLWLRASNPTR